MTKLEEAIENYGAACSNGNEYDNREEIEHTRMLLLTAVLEHTVDASTRTARLARSELSVSDFEDAEFEKQALKLLQAQHSDTRLPYEEDESHQ